MNKEFTIKENMPGEYFRKMIDALVVENKQLKEMIREAEIGRCSCQTHNESENLLTGRENDWQKEFMEIMKDRHEDNVHHPSHYDGAIEVIDFIRDKLTKEELAGYYKGNILKYIARFEKKETANPIEDIQKAQVYLGWLIDLKGGISNGQR